MTEDRVDAGPAIPEPMQAPLPQQPSEWDQAAWDAAAALLHDRLDIDPAPEYVVALLEIALWRKNCHALLTAIQARTPPDAPPSPPEEQLQLLMTEVPEAAFLAKLATAQDRTGVYLSYACVYEADEARLLHLAQVLEHSSLVVNADALNAHLRPLQAALSAADLQAATGDPEFLLRLVLLSGGGDPSDELLQAMRQSLDEARLGVAVSLLTEHGNAQGADVFALFCLQARMAHAALAAQSTQARDVPAINAVLLGVDRAEAGLLAEPSRLSAYVAHQKAGILSTLAVDPAIGAEDRRRFLDRALASLASLTERLRRSGQSPTNSLMTEARLVWMAAEMETGNARAERRAAAITRQHELLAMAALEPADMPRLTSIAAISILLATAYYETGQFVVATNQATVARHVAAGAANLFDELSNVNGEEESEAIKVMRSSFASIVAQADRADMIARARLAESRGAFKDASHIYTDAARVESELKGRMHEFLSVFFGAAGQQSKLSDPGFVANARAAHFAGMAAINLADAALMGGDQQGARTGYKEGRAKLECAAKLWDEARAHMPSGPQADEGARQAQVSTLRARYCDCKMDLAQAENLVALRDHKGAAEKFIAARTVLQELVERSLDVDENRNQQILVASKSYADARGLFEVDLDARTDANLKKARQRMNEAAEGFVAAGETRWAAFSRAQSAECEALVLRAKAEDEPADVLRDALLARASDRQRDAGEIYAQAGRPRPDGSTPGEGATPAVLVLPKPQAPIGEGDLRPGRFGSSARDQDPRKAKTARARALQMTIDDQTDLLERGIIDVGRWSAIVTDYRQELLLLKDENGEAR
jgi:hypothetical protein